MKGSFGSQFSRCTSKMSLEYLILSHRFWAHSSSCNILRSRCIYTWYVQEIRIVFLAKISSHPSPYLLQVLKETDVKLQTWSVSRDCRKTAVVWNHLPPGCSLKCGLPRHSSTLIVCNVNFLVRPTLAAATPQHTLQWFEGVTKGTRTKVLRRNRVTKERSFTTFIVVRDWIKKTPTQNSIPQLRYIPFVWCIKYDRMRFAYKIKLNREQQLKSVKAFGLHFVTIYLCFDPFKCRFNSDLSIQYSYWNNCGTRTEAASLRSANCIVTVHWRSHWAGASQDGEKYATLHILNGRWWVARSWEALCHRALFVLAAERSLFLKSVFIDVPRNWSCLQTLRTSVCKYYPFIRGIFAESTRPRRGG